MSSQIDVVPIVVASCVTFVIAESVVAFTGHLRRTDYRRFERLNEAAINDRFPINGPEAFKLDERQKAFSLQVKSMHEAANLAQTTYHDVVARSAGCLVVAFL